MSEEIIHTQSVYGSSDIAVTLKIQESTVRKYCLILEKAGYQFLKNEHGHRAFFDYDVIVLKKIIELKSGTDMTLEEAAKAVIAWKKGNAVSVSDMEEKHYNARYDELLKDFKAFKEQQIEFNKELIQEIRNQQEYINNRLEQRDLLLIQTLRETLETRKEIATAEKKWWRFWK